MLVIMQGVCLASAQCFSCGRIHVTSYKNATYPFHCKVLYKYFLFYLYFENKKLIINMIEISENLKKFKELFILYNNLKKNNIFNF